MKKRDINLQNLQIFSDLSNEEIDVFKDELKLNYIEYNDFILKLLKFLLRK